MTHLVTPTLACLILLAGCSAVAEAQNGAQPAGKGVVYHDENGNGMRDDGEPGIGGVRVSNGSAITVTDADGGYSLDVDDDTILFVIKPRGWQVPMNDLNLPQFYYIHKPAGSPPSRFAGVPPTGELPSSIDFPLHPNDEPDRFEAILFGDTQPRDVKEVNYIAHDVVEDIIGTDAAFGVTLGDIVFDDLDVFEPLNRVIAMIGIPWYNVLGNHDLNTDAVEDHHSDETFESIYGPAYYSFDYGAAHFLVVDDVSWSRPEGERGGYTGGLGEEQLAFIENDLEQIPPDQLVVVFMHIPFTRGWHEADRQALFRLLEARPLTFSVSAHTHWQAHMFLDEEDGWRGEQPHHHLINVTVCGSWWRGEPDERGIPNALMPGGGPNGHAIITFDGSRYSLRYQAAGAPEDYQMNIYAPDEISSGQAGETEVLVNVFFGSEHSTVEMRVDTGEWSALEMVLQPDPHFLQLKKLEEERGVTPGYRSLPAAQDSLHLWRGVLPVGIENGAHLIDVRTTDMFGQTYRSGRIIRVVDPSGAANAASGRRGRGGTDRR
jgi:hypothetical protein